MSALAKHDPEVFQLLQAEEERQQNKLSLIPSENFFSPTVREAVGSVFSHKYSEGNIGSRYYEGNEIVDSLEALTIERARQLFKLPADWGVNVQALAGSSANLAVYLGVLKSNDTMLAMYLPDGGHLSHGWSYEPDQEKRHEEVGTMVYHGGSRKVNITSRMFRVVQYKTDPSTQLFDYDVIEKIAIEHQPQLIITGGTAYPRDIDYARVRRIADKVGALYLADVAHEAGLIAAGVLPSPIGQADIVTLTTHKTLRAGRGALILAREDLMKKINRGVLPGLQGGPFNHQIAGICVGLGEALKPEFKVYARMVAANAQALARELSQQKFSLVSGGTDKHLVLLDLTSEGLLGKKFARALAEAGLVTNANSIPQETRGPADPSGLRLGTPWVTTRGMGPIEMKQIARWVREVMTVASSWGELEFEDFVSQLEQSTDIARLAQEVRELGQKFPLEIKAEAVKQAQP